MKPIKIEFFHDVICSFCFPMSYRMRQLQKELPDINIVHRSFALVKTEADFDIMFGSRAAAKDEILSHWKHANQNDDLHRFNINGMKHTSFPFPTSMKGLTACKAAYPIAGAAGYWDVFDALQNALFVQNLNIDDDSVIHDCIQKADIPLELWKKHYYSLETKEAVAKDLQLAEIYAVNSVPCLIVNEKYHINGAQPLSQIISALQKISLEQSNIVTEGSACRLENGSHQCD